MDLGERRGTGIGGSRGEGGLGWEEWSEAKLVKTYERFYFQEKYPI